MTLRVNWVDAGQLRIYSCFGENKKKWFDRAHHEYLRVNFIEGEEFPLAGGLRKINPSGIAKVASHGVKDKMAG